MDEETLRWLERIIAATAKLEARQLWSAATAMCSFSGRWPVIAGLWMGARRLPRCSVATWTGACGSASAGGSWSALASPGPATASCRPLGCGSRGDLKRRGMPKGPLAQEVTFPQGKREEVRRPRQLTLASGCCIVQCMPTIASRLDVS